MKIQHLPIGAHFEFEGQIFVKTGPMMAASEAGGQRVIPRSAFLHPVGSADSASAVANSSLERQQVAAAFATFYANCAGLVGENDRRELELARQRFLTALSLTSEL